jgi:hypothetical protein
MARASCLTDDSPRPEACRDRDIGLRERTEQALDLAKREADPAVGDREGDTDPAVARTQRRDPQRDAALFGEFDRIVDQVLQRGAQANGIADCKSGELFGNLDR